MKGFNVCNADLSFVDWLKERYHRSPPELYRLAVETGSRSDYYKMMEWYRRRWYAEKDLAKALETENPFAASAEVTTTK